MLLGHLISIIIYPPQTLFVSSLGLLVTMTVLTLIGESFFILTGEKVQSHRICLIVSYVLNVTSRLALSFITQTAMAVLGRELEMKDP